MHCLLDRWKRSGEEIFLKYWAFSVGRERYEQTCRLIRSKLCMPISVALGASMAMWTNALIGLSVPSRKINVKVSQSME
jgi:hypothetical protein